jgi:thiol-disulfide isomerase/thioredoxin
MSVPRVTLGLLLAVTLYTVTGAGLTLAQEPEAASDAKKLKPKTVTLPLSGVLAKSAEQDAAKLEGKTDEEKTAALKAKDEEEGKESKIDQFAIPAGGVPELLAYVQETLKFRPKSREEVLAYRLRGMASVKEAIEKIQAMATDEDKKLPGYEEVDGLALFFRAQNREATVGDREKLLDDLKAYYAANAKPTTYAINAARMLASSLEYGGNPDEAIVVYRELGNALEKFSDEAVARIGAQMVGASRRLGLVGQTMEVSGTHMDGTMFDWTKLRGKVVLVDFWATWCGPCLGELPNVRENYRLYHDKGFEVVGISLDRDREALEKFLADEQNPWITLHDGDWNDNAVASYYGVMGIPTVILVDKEGKVVSTRARGPELGKLLEQLLGPPDPAPETPAEGDKPADADKPGDATADEKEAAKVE